ncbi:MAG: GNAT family N-acetyltransferase [Thermoanaerobaculia bacterium]|jgi:acetyl coenzyme A synthetase (ADP forming)-like protein
MTEIEKTAPVVPNGINPTQWSWDVVLRTGSTMHIRAVRPNDANGILELFRGLSPAAIKSRFFDMRSPEDALLASPAVVDYDDIFGIVGEMGGRIVAVAHWYRGRKYRSNAEAAFAVSEEMRGCGVGTRLLECLAEVARSSGITAFTAEVMESNRPMMDVFLDSGFAVEKHTVQGTVGVKFSLEETDHFEEKAAERDQKAAFASMKSIFEPKSIAVVGASTRRGQLGAEVFHNLITGGFKGRLYPVNPVAETVEYVPCFARVSDIPGPVDLAIVVVPAERVTDVVAECVEKGVRAIVMITAGFGETGPAGKRREEALVAQVRAAGIRMVGPNCMGVLNTNPAVSMLGTFSSVFPMPGNIAMSTQSGALGLAILDYARQIGVGFSTFVSVGNKADVSGNDLIQYWAEDPRTQVMLLYLESFGNPNKFGRIARRVAHKKPIIAVKSGRSQSGARAASSHTGALATSDAIVNDLFRQAGIIRTNTLEEMFDVAQLLAMQPLPPGKRLGIVTNAGGPAILAADAAEAGGLRLAMLSEETTSTLRAMLPVAASVANPVDMIASATAEQYERAIELLLADDGVDAVMVIYIPVMPEHAEGVASVIRNATSTSRPIAKTIVANFMGAQEWRGKLNPVPSFPFPERAASALATASRYAEWRRKPIGIAPEFADIDRDALRAIVDRELERGGGWLEPAESDAMLRAVGLSLVQTRVAADAEEAMQIAREIGYPVVLKASGPNILHKSDVGGVKLNLSDPWAVRAAAEELKTKFGEELTGIVVQAMITSGPEVMIGAVRDPTFGHLLMYGAGGTLVELLKDVAFRIHPVTDVDVADMLEEVKTTRLLHGYRGSAPADAAAVQDAILRVSTLIELCPEIEELDINPLKVLEKGAIAVDFRVRVEKPQPKKATRRISY